MNGYPIDHGDPTSAMVARMAGDHAALAARVTDVEDRLEDFAGAFDDIEAALTEPPAPTAAGDLPDSGTPASSTPGSSGAGEGAEQATGLDMRQLVGWVRENVAQLFERKVPQTGGYPYWCRRWWMHPEAIARFEAARRSWVEAVGEHAGNAMVVYFEHLDHQLSVLCAENGPFSGCAHGHASSSNVRILGQDEPDEAYFAEFEQDHGHGQGL